MLHTFEHGANDVLTLHWLSGEIKALDDLHATSGHRFWVVGKGWTHARDLALGDVVPRATGGVAIFAGADVEVEAQQVFNFEVDFNHDYWVGPQGELVRKSVDRERQDRRIVNTDIGAS